MTMKIIGALGIALILFAGCSKQPETRNLLNDLPQWYQEPTVLGDKYAASGSAKPNKAGDIELQRIQVDRARRIREFSGNISAYYDITGVSTLGGGSTEDLFQSSFDNFLNRPPNRGITLTFSYPLFDWGRGSARIQQEEAALRSRILDREDLKVTIIREVRDVVRSVDEAKKDEA